MTEKKRVLIGAKCVCGIKYIKQQMDGDLIPRHPGPIEGIDCCGTGTLGEPIYSEPLRRVVGNNTSQNNS